MKQIKKIEAPTLNIKAVQDFTANLNLNPLPSEVKVNANANNSNYIPIGIIQNKLDETYNGLWQTKNYNTKVVANEIIGEIELHVFHPVALTWICRIGCASVMIGQIKGSAITDISSKHKNTLVKDYPHLLSECLKSASKSLGVSFGRNLNKEFIDQYQPQQNEINEVEISNTIKLINECNSMDSLKEIYNNLSDLRENKNIKKHFNLKASKIKING
jgi:hypothetical protein